MPSYQIKQASTAYPLVFLMIDSSDHVSGKTGLSPTVTLSKSGAAFAAPAGAVSEVGNGWYRVAGNAVDSGTLGPLVLHAAGTGADPTDALYEVVAVDPQAASFGLSLAKAVNITGFNDIAATAIVTAGAISTNGGAVSTVTTAVNLTNAAAAGDFTAAMKASITTAATAATPTAAAVTGLTPVSIRTEMEGAGTLLATIAGRLGSWTGSGVNTLLGAFQALLSKAAAAPSDIGGTFDPATDSTEALRDRGDAAWVTGSSGVTLDSATVSGAASASSCTATGGSLNAVSGAYNGMFALFQSGALAGERRTIASHLYSAGTHTFTFSVGFSASPQAGDTFFVG